MGKLICGFRSCVPTLASKFSDRAGLHLPFNVDRFPIGKEISKDEGPSPSLQRWETRTLSTLD